MVLYTDGSTECGFENIGVACPFRAREATPIFIESRQLDILNIRPADKD